MSDTTVNSRAWWNELFGSAWEANAGREQTRHFMERLLAHLPPEEIEYVRSSAPTVLDWGCALGDGVDVLARAFPACRVQGLDFSLPAIERARRLFPHRDFLLTEDGNMPGAVDVVICSNCLELFADPLAVMRSQLAGCRQFYAALVPLDEEPLCESHRVCFRLDSFPESVGDFRRLHSAAVEVDRSRWNGQQLLVVYGSSAYVAGRAACGLRLTERSKWDACHTREELGAEDAWTALCNEYLAREIALLLPQGGCTLEVGHGAGRQSLALARRGGFDVHLMDSSEPALRCAEEVFAREGLSARFHQGDVSEPGAREYDVVFDAGSLEHSASEQAVVYLRGLASRSRRYVLVVRPNNQCYWYWIWRIRSAAGGQWPFGQETPISHLAPAFRAAGLTFLGEAYLGETWTEEFIRSLANLDPRLCEDILSIHRSEVLPLSQKACLYAALGTVDAAVSPPEGTAFSAPPPAPAAGDPVWQAASADLLAERMQVERLRRELKDGAIAKQQAIAAHRRLELSLGWRALQGMNAVVDRLRLRRVVDRCDGAVRWVGRTWLRRREVWQALKQLGRTPRRPAAAQAGAEDVLVWGVIDWHFRIQRPQHLARGLVAAGRRVFYVSANLVDSGHPGMRVERLDESGRLFQVRLQAAAPPGIYQSPAGPEAIEQLRGGLGNLLRWGDIGPVVNIVQHPFWLPLARSVPNARMVYDCMDHHEGFGDMQPGLLRLERDLLAEADLTVVSSEVLRGACAGRTARTLVVRNACAYEDFSRPPSQLAVPSDGRRRIGYYGAIAGWFDTELVAAVAQALPACEVLLVGADTAGAARQLAHVPNVRFTGEVPYAALPGYLHAFDVCLLPFRIEPLTAATNPVKVYEYLAAGKPVVAVRLPELAQFGGLVDVVDGVDAFVVAVQRHVEHQSTAEVVATRQAFARGQTWDRRVAALLEGLASIPDAPVSVVVVTYNNLALTQTCLDSVARYSGYAKLEVIVVDNASQDGTPDFLRTWEAGEPGRRVLLNAENRGFAAANNQGLAAAQGDYLVMLNNDTHVTPGWVRTLVNHLRRDPRLGLVGPVTNNIGNEARIQLGYAGMPAMLRKARAHAQVRAGRLFPLETAAFFCVAMRRSTYERVGPLDEAFGTGYFEDDDYCRRVEKLGLTIRCAEDVFVHHHLSASFDLMQAARRKELFERNRVIYEKKWGPWLPHQPRADRG